METSATAATAEAGVTTGGNTPTPSTEASPSSDSNKNQAPSTDGKEGEEVLPFGTHPRWKEMLKNNRDLSRQLKELKAELQGVDGVRALDAYLRQHPEKYQTVAGWLSGKDDPLPKASSSEEDPFAQYDPEVQKQFKLLAELKEWKEQKDKEATAYFEKAKTRNLNALDRSFDEMLIRDGFMDKEGNGDQDILDTCADVVMSRLVEIAEDPNFPTQEELKTAYSKWKRSVESVEKKSLKKVVNDDVPPSGSKRGSPPIGKKTMSDDERIMDIANSY